MTRDQLAHILRAAARIAEASDVVVIGSQSILGTYAEDELPDPAVGSLEADLAFFDDHDNAKSDRVDAMIGEGSMFHEEFGYYGQGVSISTATLPAGWQDRIVILADEQTQPGRGLCLETHDLVVSKLAAGREGPRVRPGADGRGPGRRQGPRTAGRRARDGARGPTASP